MRTLIIGEIASAHDGSLDKALRLIDAVADAGADVAKAEYWSDPDKLADRRHVPAMFREHYRRYRVPYEWLPAMAERCDARNIEFMCTTYLAEDIATVAPFVTRFKVAGFEVQDVAFIMAHAPFNKDVLASVPLSVWPPIYPDIALPSLHLPHVRLLHCCQTYPIHLDDLHLNFIRLYGLAGFSDHSGLIKAGAAAVFAGARIIEAHVKLVDTDPTNYDAGVHAHTPQEFALYILRIREAERMLGTGDKTQSFACEAESAQYRVTA